MKTHGRRFQGDAYWGRERLGGETSGSRSEGARTQGHSVLLLSSKKNDLGSLTGCSERGRGEERGDRGGETGRG